MKRILFLLVACIMATGFLASSEVLAVDLTKLPNTEWSMKGIATKYNADGYYGSAVISQGMLFISNPADGVLTVHNVSSDMYFSILGLLTEFYCSELLKPYTLGVDKIKSTTCTLNCIDAAGNPLFSAYSGACNAKIVFSSGTDFTGTISVTDYWGAGLPWVFTITGKKVGKYPSTISPGEILSGKIPDSLNNFLKK